MRFREIREIKTSELRNKNKEEEQGYRKIKPESMTFEEARAFWDNLWANMGKKNKD